MTTSNTSTDNTEECREAWAVAIAEVTSLSATVPNGFLWEAREELYWPETVPQLDADGCEIDPKTKYVWAAAAREAVTDWNNCTGAFSSRRHP